MTSHKNNPSNRLPELSTVSVPEKPTKSRGISPIQFRSQAILRKSHKSETDVTYLKEFSQGQIERLKHGNQWTRLVEPDFQQRLLKFGMNSINLETSMNDQLNKIKVKCSLLNDKLKEALQRAEEAEQALLKAQNETSRENALIELLKRKLFDTTLLLKSEHKQKESAQIQVEKLQNEIEGLVRNSEQPCDETKNLLENDQKENFMQEEITKYDKYLQSFSSTFEMIKNDRYQRMRKEEQKANLIATEASLAALLAKKTQLETSLQCSLQEKQDLEAALVTHAQVQNPNSKIWDLIHKSSQFQDHYEVLGVQIFNALQSQNQLISSINTRILTINETICFYKEKLNRLQRNQITNDTNEKDMNNKLLFVSNSQHSLDNFSASLKEEEIQENSQNDSKEVNCGGEFQKEIENYLMLSSASNKQKNPEQTDNLCFVDVTSSPNKEKISGKIIMDWLCSKEMEDDELLSQLSDKIKDFETLLKEDDPQGNHEIFHKRIFIPPMNMDSDDLEMSQSNLHKPSEICTDLSISDSISLLITQISLQGKRKFENI